MLAVAVIGKMWSNFSIKKPRLKIEARLLLFSHNGVLSHLYLFQSLRQLNIRTTYFRAHFFGMEHPPDNSRILDEARIFL